MPRIKTFVILSLLFVVSSGQISAQSNLEVASKNYKIEYTNYRNSQEVFLKSKVAYKSYQTVASKNDAYLKTKAYLKQVDSLYLSYYTLLGETLESEDAQDNGTLKKETKNLIDSEIGYIRDHQTRVDSAKNLEELPPLAQEFKQRQETIGTSLSNLSLSVIDYLETATIFTEFKNISSQIQNGIDNREDSANSLFQNWKSELSILKNESQIQIDNARKAIDKKSTTYNKIDHEEVKNSLGYVRARMLKASKLFEEILKAI